MKKILKKSMSILLAFTLLFGSFAFGFSDVNFADFAVKAEAATGGKCGDNLTWTFNESTDELVISGTGDMYDYYHYDNMPWYSYQAYIKHITIGNVVTSIGDFAFSSCSRLTSVTIPDSVTSIGDHAFRECASLTSITIPDSVTIIGNEAFYACGSLTSVTIGNSVTSIGDEAFSWCDSLTSITVDSANTSYSSDEYGVLFNKDKTELIQYPIGNTRTSYIIPNSVTSIGHSVFSSCDSLTSITIPNSVTSIGESAFSSCDSLTSITIGNGVTSIDDYAFSSCTNLTSITIGNSVTSIGNEAFSWCDSLTSIIIPDSVTSIGDGAFYDCTSLTDVYYNGTEAKWNEISIGSRNDDLLNAMIHFNYVAEDEPSTEVTTKPVETTTQIAETTTKVEETTAPATEPSTTEPVEVPTTTKPVETTKPTATKPVTTTKPEPTTVTIVEEEIIKKPSTTKVKYGDTLILHADFTNIPDGAKIEWGVEGEGVTIEPSADGKTCAVTSTATGDVTITAKYTDANGVEHVSEQEIESNAGLWQKIVSFFKNLFSINRIIEQVVKF